MQYQKFDFRGLKCPLPVLKARRALKPMEIGQSIIVTADDPAAPIDFTHFCQIEGHRIEQHSQQNGVFTFVICKLSS